MTERITKRRDPEGRMPLAEHLRELRNRLLYALIGIALASVVGWFLYDPLAAIMVEPLDGINERGGHAELNFGSVGVGFELHLKMAAFIGLFISSPWWILQGWLFIAPALKRKEKIMALSFTGVAALLFLTGGLLGWMILPRAVVILTGFAPEFAVNLLDARIYYRFFMQIIAAFGVSFLLPVVMVGVNFVGLIKGTSYLKGWRWAVIGCAVFSALVNPLPDAWSMLAILLPMLFFYFIATGLCILHDRRKAKRRSAELGELLGDESEGQDWIQP
ncbi:twin-arginine translocase subunit TatC [Flaviflexus sp.]|uniref:twin-arginine translocase subunit TatC n=1 Tax=Flaviflexus sp. TaxID=1969482 RepID=UPI003F91AF3A